MLKDESRELLQDAKGLFKDEEPIIIQHKNTQRQCWDIEDFESWDSLKSNVRVVRSIEKTPVRRQMTGKIEIQQSEWMWASTITKDKLDTEDFINFGQIGRAHV